MKLRPSREIADRLALAAAMLVVLVWVAYFWESSTSLTWATRSYPGTSSTPVHLKSTLNRAIGITAICGPLAIVYFAVLRRRN